MASESEIMPARLPAAPSNAPGGRSLLPLIVLTGLLTEVCGLVLWLDVIHPAGMLSIDGSTLEISYLSRLEPLGIVAFCGIGFALLIARTRLATQGDALATGLARHWRKAMWLFIGAGVFASLAAVWALRAFPNSGDEYDYIFQAKTFLAHRLWNPVPPRHEFFQFFWQVFRDGEWRTTYPPGWPFLLAATMALRLPPWLATPAAGGVLLYALFKLGQRREGELGGILAVGLVAVSPFFMFNAASYFMHVPAAAAGALFCWAALEFLDRPRPLTGCLAGIALGGLGLIRPEDVPLFAAPFAVEFLWRARHRHYAAATALIAGGLPFLLALLLYNHAVVGSALPNTRLDSPLLRFGFFPVDETGRQLTPIDELRYVASRLVMLAEWTSPLLTLGYAAAFAWLAIRRRLGFLDFIFPLFVAAYLLVPFAGGNQYGPRYYFEAYPLFALTAATGLAYLWRNATRVRARAFAAALLVAHLAICVPAAFVIADFMRVVVDQRMDLYDQVAARHLADAVVVVHSSTSAMAPMSPRDLTRNGITLDRPVIYALDISGRMSELRQLFPQRRFFIYERRPHSPTGTLRPLP